ncbi:MAG: hypothetical protein WC750_06040 [Patescibacteria group bacterium]|jgi:hypothetical protein
MFGIKELIAEVKNLNRQVYLLRESIKIFSDKSIEQNPGSIIPGEFKLKVEMVNPDKDEIISCLQKKIAKLEEGEQ